MPNQITSTSKTLSWLIHTIAGANQSLITITISVLALILFLVSLILNRSTKKTQKYPPLPPGPKGLPLIGNFLSLDYELHTHFVELAKIYGPIFTLKLGFKNLIVISSPAIAKEILKDQDITFSNRDLPAAGKEGTYGGRDIVSNNYGPEWKMLRKVCVHDMLSNKTLDDVAELRHTELRKTIKYLYSRAGSQVNIGDQMFVNAMNVITSVLWGGKVDEGEEREILGKRFKEVITEKTRLIGIPNLSDFFPVIARFDVQGILKKVKEIVRKLDDIFEAIISERIHDAQHGGGKIRKDFLQVLLQLKEEKAGDADTPFTMTHIKALLMDMVVAGTETTSNTIEFTLAELLKKPEVLEKILNELETVVGNDRIVVESDINNLPYLQAVMKEALRLHPPLPLLVPHSPDVISIVGGYSVPPGSRVLVNVWAIQRDPSVWDNPLEFCPERFLNARFDYTGSDFKYFPFGSGRRICVGTSMAERMFMYSLASLVHSFHWSLPKGEKLDFTEKFGIVMKKRIPLVAIPTPRLSNLCLYE